MFYAVVLNRTLVLCKKGDNNNSFLNVNISLLEMPVISPLQSPINTRYARRCNLFQGQSLTSTSTPDRQLILLAHHTTMEA